MKIIIVYKFKCRCVITLNELGATVTLCNKYYKQGVTLGVSGMRMFNVDEEPRQALKEGHD